MARSSPGRSFPEKVVHLQRWSSLTGPTETCRSIRAVARLSEQTRQVSRAPRRELLVGSGACSPGKFLNLLPLKCCFQHFFVKFFFKIQYRASEKTADFFGLSTFFILTIRASPVLAPLSVTQRSALAERGSRDNCLRMLPLNQSEQIRAQDVDFTRLKIYL